MNVLSLPLASLNLDGEQLALSPSEMTQAEESVFTTTIKGVRIDLTVTFPTANAFTTMLRLTNTSTENSPRITTVRSFDTRFPAAAARFDGITGDSCGGESFASYTRPLTAEPYILEPTEGRSSDTSAFPFFDIIASSPEGSEVTYVFGVGWTGQWHGEFVHTGETFGVSVGLADCDFYLLPGESVRFPKVLCLAGTDPVSSHVAFRRLMRERFSPQADMEEELLLPMAIQPFDRYYQGHFGAKINTFWDTEVGQMAEIDVLDKIPALDTVWMDAGWFGGGWPAGLGNYSFAYGFPNGLRPVTDYAHQKGKKFVLWFEPERVLLRSELERKHPEYLLHRDPIGERWPLNSTCCFNLADPDACRYITDVLYHVLAEQNVDIFRMDCNIDPLPYWRKNDAPDRRGITELHYVENLYWMWDELRARKPGLLIDVCASGGRRLDLESLSRAVTMWRSDTGCYFDRGDYTPSIWNTQQIITLSRYLPYAMVGHWNCTPYDVRSTGTSGMACNYDILAPDFDCENAQTILSEAARIRPLWNGDFYPLSEPDVRVDNWAAYQLHRENRGAVYAFRKKEASAEDYTVSLYAIEPSATYRVTLTDERMRSESTVLRGAELQTYTFRTPGMRESLLLEYERC